MTTRPRRGTSEPSRPTVHGRPRHAAGAGEPATGKPAPADVRRQAPINPPSDAPGHVVAEAVEAPGEVAIDVSHLTVVRGNRMVLPDLSVQIPRGLVTGLLGPSGGGKSTLIRAIVGVQIVESGTISVLGQPAGSPQLRRRVGYVTQAPSVYDDLSIRENLNYFARLVGASADDVGWAIDQVGLADHAGQRVSNLSGGQLSRTSLACALVGRPEALVLDEPTVGLDPVLRRSLWTLFHQLADAGTTLLVSSHVMDEASRCDRLLLLREGRILADGTFAALLRRTNTHDAEDAFLALIDAEDAEDAAQREDQAS